MTIIIEPRKEKVERESVQNQTNQKPIKQTKPATIKKNEILGTRNIYLFRREFLSPQFVLFLRQNSDATLAKTSLKFLSLLRSHSVCQSKRG